MFWCPTNFKRLVELLPTFLRKPAQFALVGSVLVPLDKLHKETLYKMQHDGRTIYLEKVLNEWFKVAGYNTNNHEGTKTVYIDDLPGNEKLYIHQNEEPETLFLEDEDSDDDIFLDTISEGVQEFSWTIYVPDTYSFTEINLRALVDAYRYFGKKYTIQTYTI